MRSKAATLGVCAGILALAQAHWDRDQCFGKNPVPPEFINCMGLVDYNPSQWSGPHRKPFDARELAGVAATFAALEAAGELEGHWWNAKSIAAPGTFGEVRIPGYEDTTNYLPQA